VVGFWGAYQRNLTIQSGYSVPLQPVTFPYTDAVRFFYCKPTPVDGQGVRVAVVDTGVGPHPHLRLVEGWNTVRGEPSTDFETNGNPHGTHVAGIIASQGDPLATPAGIWGLAPAVDLVSFRVFGANNGLSTNYSIVKAILYAIRHPTSGLQCDIINLSISGDPVEDPVMLAALQDACDHGILVVAAAGNNYRQPVSPLARYAFQEGVSVSACGRKGTYPAGAYEESHFDPSPAAAQPDDFMAAFTNIGDVSMTAPGVGIISTVPPDGYAPLSGTSMACPVIAGFAARLWSQTPALFHAARDRQRVVNFVNHLNTFAATLGFAFAYEGSGMPR
jgi:subtilisin